MRRWSMPSSRSRSDGVVSSATAEAYRRQRARTHVERTQNERAPTVARLVSQLLPIDDEEPSTSVSVATATPGD